jgi:hypothetical protein
MTAAYEELLHVLDEHEITYSTGEDESIRTMTLACVRKDLFRVAAMRFCKSRGQPSRHRRGVGAGQLRAAGGQVRNGF